MFDVMQEVTITNKNIKTFEISGETDIVKIYTKVSGDTVYIDDEIDKTKTWSYPTISQILKKLKTNHTVIKCLYIDRIGADWNHIHIYLKRGN